MDNFCAIVLCGSAEKGKQANSRLLPLFSIASQDNYRNGRWLLNWLLIAYRPCDRDLAHVNLDARRFECISSQNRFPIHPIHLWEPDVEPLIHERSTRWLLCISVFDEIAGREMLICPSMTDTQPSSSSSVIAWKVKTIILSDEAPFSIAWISNMKRLSSFSSAGWTTQWRTKISYGVNWKRKIRRTFLPLLVSPLADQCSEIHRISDYSSQIFRLRYRCFWDSDLI